MGLVTEEEFEIEDDRNKGYSNVEYDLTKKVRIEDSNEMTGLSIRKNLTTNRYEIFEIKTGVVHYSYTDIHDIVRVANDIEGSENTWVKE